ncbi:hypothetical protein [Microvirga zambiensis]|nr:hypothetical protein [Microvirga zambiensis]
MAAEPAQLVHGGDLAAAGPETRMTNERQNSLHAVRTVLGFAAGLAFL